MTTNRIRIKDKVNREFVKLLFDDFHLLLIGESLSAFIYTVVLWNSVSSTLLVTWLIFMLLINGVLRHIVTYLYNRNRRANTIKNISLWRRRFIFMVGVAGLMWALGGCFFLLVDTDELRMLILIFLIAVIGSGNAVFLPDKYAFLTFVTPIYLVLFFMSYTQHSSIYIILSLGILIQFLLSFRLAFNASRVIINSMAYQFKNTELLQKIILAKNQVETLSSNLTDENAAIVEVEKALHDLATHDELTGLPNRHFLKMKLRQSQERSRRHQTYTGILFLDLDFFKEINDSLGHPVGDKLLIEAAQRMKHSLRDSDTVARLGGDEFCMVLDSIKIIDDISVVAKKITEELAKPYDIDGHQFAISASVGIAVFPGDSDDIETLFRHADAALYKAKNQGRNTWRFYNEKYDSANR